MTSTTFFANRATVAIVTGVTEYDASATFAATTGVSNVSAGTYSAGNYLYNKTDDTYFDAARIASFSGTDAVLEYAYAGTTGASKLVGKLTTTTVAVLKGVEITTAFEHEELYGMDSALRQDVAKHTTGIEFKVSHAKFNPDPAAGWEMDILKPAGGDGSTSDVNTVFSPYVILTVLDTSTTYQEIILKNVYFEGLPTNLPENDYIVRELNGKGSDIRFRSYT